jgi:sortase A
VDDNGLMCFVEIPSINVYLPVYHGTSEDTLEQGAGHMMGTSMPVGGEDTHTVISAHTGMSKMRMFTDLIDVKKGEFFFLHTLGQTLAYKVDRIDIVEPAEMNLLNVEKGEDLCTLITCTPYGVNSHRLLVRGKRTPYDPEAAQRAREMATKSVRGQSQWLREYVKAASSGFGLIAGIATFGFLYSRMQRQNENKRKETSSWY